MNLKLVLYFLAIFWLISLGFIFSQFSHAEKIERKEILVLRAVDGDTIDSNIGRIRLLGINTPEKKFQYYQEAKDFLGNYENLTLELETSGKDKYGRTLAYLYFDSKLVNAEILEQGLANLYVYDKDKNYPKLKEAEDYARKNNLGIWNQSRNSGCLRILEFNYSELERCHNQETLVLENLCPQIEAIIKDDATHTFFFNISRGRFETNFSCIFNDEGDSLFIWDKYGLLVFYRYP